jgi:glycosyltransferase involved in cell wall biosynthesis
VRRRSAASSKRTVLSRCVVSLIRRDAGSTGGIARYVDELTAGLAGSAEVELQLTSVPRLPIPLGGSLGLLRLPLRDVDVVHFPMHESFPVFAALRPPVLMTIHSVEPLFLSAEEVYGGAAPRLWRLPYRLLRVARAQLRLVITPSETTASEIERYLHIPRERIRVIPHGVSPVFFDRSIAPYVLPNRQPYVLHVSHHQPQKNVARLLEALARVAGVELVIGGDTSRCDAAYARAIERHSLGDRVHFLGPVGDDAKLAALYRGATMFALPSFHESFGLPVLEAAAAGCPAIVGRGTGAAETAAGGAVTVDPRSVDEIAEAMIDLAGDEALRAELGEVATVRAAGFTWAKSIAAHERAYREAAS